MIIYNTTFSVPEELHSEFLVFIREEYLPEALKSQIIREPRLSRVFSNSEEDGFSYALEFKAASIDELERWNLLSGKKLHFLLIKKFRQNILGFSTVLKPVNL